MSEEQQPDTRHEKRVRRSTRIGVVALVMVAIIAIAVVWGISEWAEDDDDTDAPSVNFPGSHAVAAQVMSWKAAA